MSLFVFDKYKLLHYNFVVPAFKHLKTFIKVAVQVSRSLSGDVSGVPKETPCTLTTWMHAGSSLHNSIYIKC